MNTNGTNLHTDNMKKAFILAVTLIAAGAAACFAGCETSQGDKVSLSDNGIISEETAMPKVRFDFKDGTPV